MPPSPDRPVAATGGTASVVMRATATLTVDAVEVASALRPDGVTPADLARLLALVLEAQQRQASPEEVADQVEEQVPIFADLGQHLRTGPGQLHLLAIIVAAVIGILAYLKPAAPTQPPVPPIVNVQIVVPSKDEIAEIVEEEMRERGLLDRPADDRSGPAEQAHEQAPKTR